MSVFESNVKMQTLNKTDELKYKCGSVRVGVNVFRADGEDRTWCRVVCKACGNLLFYNGA